MDPSFSDLEFFDFNNSSDEEIKEIQAILKGPGSNGCVELPWEISVKGGYPLSLPESEGALLGTVPESTKKSSDKDVDDTAAQTLSFASLQTPLTQLPPTVKAFVSLPTTVGPYQNAPYFVSRTLPYLRPYPHMGVPFFACPMPGTGETNPYGQFVPMAPIDTEPSSKRASPYGQFVQMAPVDAEPKRQSSNRRSSSKKRLSEGSSENVVYPDSPATTCPTSVPLVPLPVGGNLPMHGYPPGLPSPAMYYVPVFNHPYGGYLSPSGPHMMLPVNVAPDLHGSEEMLQTNNGGELSQTTSNGGSGESSQTASNGGSGESSQTASNGGPGESSQTTSNGGPGESSQTASNGGPGESSQTASNGGPGESSQTASNGGPGESLQTASNGGPGESSHSTSNGGPGKSLQADRDAIPTDNICIVASLPTDSGGTEKVQTTPNVQSNCSIFDTQSAQPTAKTNAPERIDSADSLSGERSYHTNFFQETAKCLEVTVPSEVLLLETLPSKASCKETVPSKLPLVETVPLKVSRIETPSSKRPFVETVPSKVPLVEMVPPKVSVAPKDSKVEAKVTEKVKGSWADLFRTPPKEMNGFDPPLPKQSQDKKTALNNGKRDIANGKVYSVPASNSFH